MTNPYAEHGLAFTEVEDRPSRSLNLNFWSTLVGNGGYAACQWGMVIVLAKLCSPQSVGQFALGFALAAPIFMFSNLQLRAAQATDVKREYFLGDYLGLRVIATSLALIFLAVTAFFSGYRGETASIILAVGLAKGVESISDVFCGVFQQRERMDRVATSTLARGVLSLGALALLTFVTGSVFWGTVGMCLAGVAVVASYDIPVAARMLAEETTLAQVRLPRPRWNPKVLMSLARLTLPLGFVAMLVSLNMNIPRYFISRELGESELGVFSALAYLMVPGLTILNALGQAAIPGLAACIVRNDFARFREVLSRMLVTALGLGAAGVLVGTLAGREVLTLLYRPEYAESSRVFLWLLVAGGSLGVTSVLGTVVTAMRVFRAQLVIQVLCSLVVLICAWLLVARMGMLGAALSLLASSIASTAAYGLVAVRSLSPGGEDRSH